MAEWWRNAVLYEIYVRSFADSNGDGVGDLPGIRARLPYVAALGVDGIWLTPFYPSPGADHGYDVSDYVDVDPLFGTLDDFDALLAEALALGLEVVVDIVPNHTSSEHPWFRNALSGCDHPDRGRYVFAPPRNGGPPNNWPSTFGGPAWTFDERSGECYLHLFAPEQPDLNWHNPVVRQDFEEILRFWLDRGVDGFRIDVAHALFKDPQLRDEPEPFPDTPVGSDWRTAIDQPEVHALYREWRSLADSYGDRMLVGEVFFYAPKRLAPYVRPDELHLAFNFTLLFEPWDAPRFRRATERTLAALGEVGAPATWVLESHDAPRLATRYGGGELGLRRARAASLLLLALPGTAFLYAGQELGLEEVDLPDDVRQDPLFFRTQGRQKGRDGCRVPIPWEADEPGLGFTTGTPWLPMEAEWAGRSVAAQEADPASFLSLYRRALALRRASDALRHGMFAWRECPDDALVFERVGDGERIVCAVNLGAGELRLPAGDVLLASEPVEDGILVSDAAAWVRAALSP
jgi:alpha-glucosidase